jgi:hypothetical protein
VTWRQSPYFSIPFIEVANYEIDLVLVALVDINLWSDLVCIPIARYGEVISICTVNPSESLRDQLEELLKLRVLFIRCSARSLSSVLSRLLPGGLSG